VTAAPAPAAVAEALAAVAARHGTPAYVYDLASIRARASDLAGVLPAGIGVRYSVKANPAPVVCQVIAAAGLGAEVSSAAELGTALEAGFGPDQILVTGPYKEEELQRRAGGLRGALVSVDSLSELRQLAAWPGPAPRIVLRLRPDYPPPGEMCPGSPDRFGIPAGQLTGDAADLARAAGCAGFHVYGGSQILDPAAAAQNLASAHDLAMRAGASLDLVPEVLNLGGGFGVPYDEHGRELDLTPAAATLRALAAGAPGTQLVIELGRYLVASAGWYLTRVVHHQSYDGLPAVVVDGGIHHRPDLCGLDLARRSVPPLLLGPPREGATPTAVLGCLCLPWDVLAYGAGLPPLRVGDVLAFPNAGAYGLTAAPTGFLGHRLPAEVALDGQTLTHRPPPQHGTAQRDLPARVP
jgi:diaminopimelate decarboxylase